MVDWKKELNRAYNIAKQLPTIPQASEEINKKIESQKSKFDKSQGIVKNVANLGKNAALDLAQQVNSVVPVVVDPIGNTVHSIKNIPQTVQGIKEGAEYYKNNPDRIAPDLGQTVYQYPATTAMLVTGIAGGAKGAAGVAKNVSKVKPVNQTQIVEQLKPKTTPNIKSIQNGITKDEILNSNTKKTIPESYGKNIDDMIDTVSNLYDTMSVTPENDYQINTSIPRSTGELLPEPQQRYLMMEAQKQAGKQYNTELNRVLKNAESKYGKENLERMLNDNSLFANNPELYQRFSEPTLLNLGALQEQMSPFRFNQLRNDRLVLQPELKVTEGYQGYTGYTSPNNSNYLKQFKPNLDLADLDNEIIVVNKNQTPAERIATNRHELGHLAVSGNNPESAEFSRFKRMHNYPDIYNESVAYGVGDIGTNKVPDQKLINEYYKEANYDPQLSQLEVLNQRKLFEDDIRRYFNINKLGLTQDPAVVAQYESMMKQLDPTFTSAFKPNEYYTPFSFDQIRSGEHLYPQQLNSDPRFIYYNK